MGVAVGSVKPKPKYTLSVERLDDGLANVKLFVTDEKGTRLAIKPAVRGGWDDAIPWSSGTYNTKVKDGGFSGLPAWDIIEKFEDREGLLFHTAFKDTAKVPGTYASYGCLLAEGAFIVKVKNLVKDGPMKVQVGGVNPTIGLNLESSSQTIAEGDKFTLNVKMTGDANGVSKDCYVLVKQTTVVGVANANFKDDFTFDSKMYTLYGKHNDAVKDHRDTKWTIKEKLLFVKIDRHSTDGKIDVSVKTDKVEGDEYASFQIVDYYFNSPRTPNAERYYSDYKSTVKVLIKNGTDTSETIKITDTPSLDNLNLSQSGGIEGFSQTYSAKFGVTYTWNFDAYGIPDTLRIYDNTGYYALVDNKSSAWTSSFQLRKGSDGVIHVDVLGSAYGTSWDLGIYSQSLKYFNGVEPKSSENFAAAHHYNLVSGTLGNDTLRGSNDYELFVGGAGHDTFIFDATSFGRHDVVRDFKPGADKLFLSSESFQLPSGVLEKDSFFVGAKSHDLDDRIIYNPKTGALLYDIDGAGGADPMQFASIAKGLNISHLDFLIG
jgi:hypothetical protein